MGCQPSEWNKTRYTQILEMAQIFGIPFRQALAMRHTFLDDLIKRYQVDIDEELEYLQTCEEEFEFRIYLESVAGKMKIINKLEKSRPVKPSDCDISEDDIYTARAVTVDKLIKFNRGKAVAFCHEDKNPSMFHATRKNLAICPVCDRMFGPIDILIERDGMTFIEAVKYLGGM